jgi:2-polyprenyl-6-methoxyphenol hydroxylase-like FAD-dependent oxidoreductase
MSDLIRQTVSPPRVAIIGSGPGGLVTAKFLKQHGFEPVLFEETTQSVANGMRAQLAAESGLRW